MKTSTLKTATKSGSYFHSVTFTSNGTDVITVIDRMVDYLHILPSRTTSKKMDRASAEALYKELKYKGYAP